MFTQQKIAQMAAYLLQLRGGLMSHLKLMKLLYLADRQALRELGAPISWDRAVSMPQGPVLSTTLDLMNGGIEPAEGGWEDWISDKENHEVALRKEPSREELDELSDAELEILQAVWQRFGQMDRWQLRDYTHQHCTEWEDPDGSSKPIDVRAMLRAEGWDDAEAEELAEEVEAERRTAESLSA